MQQSRNAVITARSWFVRLDSVNCEKYLNRLWVLHTCVFCCIAPHNSTARSLKGMSDPKMYLESTFMTWIHLSALFNNVKLKVLLYILNVQICNLITTFLQMCNYKYDINNIQLKYTITIFKWQFIFCRKGRMIKNVFVVINIMPQMLTIDLNFLNLNVLFF